MAVIFRYPLTSTFGAGSDALGSFDAIRSLQANGISTAGDEIPNGSGEWGKIVDGWARLKMWETDAPWPGGESIRTEITGPDEAVPSVRLYRWESRFEDWPVTPDEFVVMQIHANHPGAAYAEEVLIRCNGERLAMYLPLVEPPLLNAASRLVAAMPMQNGTIYKHALLVRWDKTGRGALLWIVNGAVMFNSSLIGTEYDYPTGPYFKVGVYTGGTKPPGWGSRTQYVRNVVVTDGLDSKSWTELIGDIPRPRPFPVL